VVTLSANSIAKSPITGSETLNNESTPQQLITRTSPLSTAVNHCTESDGKRLTGTGFAKF